LVIRLRAGRFHLACCPGEGEQHAPGCWFFRTPAGLPGRAGYSLDGITEGPDGVQIRVDAQLTVNLTPADPPATGRPRTPGRSRRVLSQLGLLHFLWEQAGLHLHQPDTSRRWADCHAAPAGLGRGDRARPGPAR
jgi:hypothetical protein